eukprot:3105649-Pyramimonas_sp.AAC.1
MSGAVFFAVSCATAPLDSAALGLSASHGAVGATVFVQFTSAERTFYTCDALVNGDVVNVLRCQEAWAPQTFHHLMRASTRNPTGRP